LPPELEGTIWPPKEKAWHLESSIFQMHGHADLMSPGPEKSRILCPRSLGGFSLAAV
jgi:hypothetical protein